MRKATLLLIPFLLLFVSCSNDDNETNTEFIEGNVSGVSVQPLNNGGQRPSFNNDQRYPTDAFMLAIGITTDSQPWLGGGYGGIDLGDPIIAIRIYSLGKFNEDYPAGSDVSKLFKEYPIFLDKKLHDTIISEGEVIRLDYSNGYFYKALLTPPDPGVNKLRVEIKLRSGKTFTAETEELEFF